MNGKQISTVKELIELLQLYPEDTEVNHLTGDQNTMKITNSLFIVETYPLGDKDSEDIITLSFANNDDPFDSSEDEIF